jgi:hypothetical protein
MTNSKAMRRHWIAPAAILLLTMDVRAECSLQKLAPQGSEVRTGVLTLNLGEADNLFSPTGWQGPLVAGACTFGLDIIEQPLMLAGSDLLYVPTYSGSARTLTLVDLSTCAVRWKSATFSGSLRIGPHELNLGGKRVALDAQCLPVPEAKPAARSDETVLQAAGFYFGSLALITGVNVRSAKS